MIIPSTFPKVLRDPNAPQRADLTVQSPEQEADARRDGYTLQVSADEAHEKASLGGPMQPVPGDRAYDKVYPAAPPTTVFGHGLNMPNALANAGTAGTGPGMYGSNAHPGAPDAIAVDYPAANIVGKDYKNVGTGNPVESRPVNIHDPLEFGNPPVVRGNAAVVDDAWRNRAGSAAPGIPLERPFSTADGQPLAESEYTARHGYPQPGGGIGPFPNASTSTPRAFLAPRPVAYAVSHTALEIGTGRVTFILPDGRPHFALGSRARATSTDDAANFMEGVVTKYKTASTGAAPNGTTLVISVDAVSGGGEHAHWDINEVLDSREGALRESQPFPFTHSGTREYVDAGGYQENIPNTEGAPMPREAGIPVVSPTLPGRTVDARGVRESVSDFK